MKQVITGFLLLSLLIFAGNAAVQAEFETELTVAVGEVGAEYDTVVAAAEQYMAENPEIYIEVIDSPAESGERLSYFMTYFERESSEVDIYQIDVIWPGILEEHLIDLHDYGAEEHLEGHFDFIVDNNTTPEGELIAMPWFIDTGMLYYRADLLEKYELEVPETWAELEEKAVIIMEGEREENPDFEGFVWQGAPYEGLTTNVLEWFASNAGGNFVAEDREVTVLNDNNLYMLEKVINWMGDITPLAVTGFIEEDSRAVWHEGNAAFMRNWPYAYGLTEESEAVEDFGITRIPAGPEGESASALGGWHLGVSRYSGDPEAAAEFTFFLASAEIQKMRAIEASLPPTIEELYQDEEILAENPLFEEFLDIFETAVPRPSVQTAPYYEAVSEAIFSEIHLALTGERDALTALENLEIELEEIMQWE